jgi:hypothetical protein
MSRQDLLSRMRRGLAHLVSPDEEIEVRRTPRARSTTDRPVDLDSSANFAAGLKKLFADGALGTSGSGYVCQIGLGKIKARFGSSWARIEDRADRIARNTVERYLARGDIYGAVEGPAYVVVFVQLTEEKAKAKCVLIAREIANALVGEAGIDVLDLKSGAANADGSYGLQEVAIDDLFLLNSAAMDRVEVADHDGGDPDSANATRAGKATESSDPRACAPPTAASSQLTNLRVSYRPIWDRARNVVSTYLCVGHLPSDGGSGILWEGALVTRGNPADRAQFDEAVLARALGHLSDLVRERRVALVAVPVHFETLGASARRRRIAELLDGRMSESERKLLVIEIDGVPAGAPQARLLDMIAPLRRNCRAVILRLRIEALDFANLKGCGAKAVSVDIGEHAGTEVTIIPQMNRFARLAREKGGLESCVLGADTTSLATAALGAGFDYIGGDAVAKPVDHPGGLVDFSTANLFIGSGLT